VRLRRLEPHLRRALRGPCALPPGSSILIASSGGADSTALLVALHAVAPEFGLRLRAAHLHHGLRGAEADADQAAVRDLCARFGIPLSAARWDCRARMRRRGLSGQAGLRTLRREFLIAAARRSGARAIATAHTADDQLETVLLRLARGTGLAGLGGMSARRGRWIKPLLAATRAEIETDLREAGIGWREDRSNDDPAYARSRVRNQVIPALLAAAAQRASTSGRPSVARAGLARRVASTAGDVRGAARWLSRVGDRILRRHGRIERDEIRLETHRIASYAPPIQRAVLLRCWRRLGGRVGLTSRHLGALRGLIRSRGDAVIDLPGGYIAERRRNVLVIGATRVARETHARVPRRGRWTRHSVDGAWLAGSTARRRMREAVRGAEVFAADGIAAGLELRPGRPDERFVPFGQDRARTLKRFLSKQPVHRALRAHPMVLADTRGILWVVGVRRSARAPLTESTRRALWVHAEHR
jgi:tRNA(Ile)-lysidine synthase